MKYKLQGHGSVRCKKCKKVLVSCRCMKAGDNIEWVVCEECEAKPKVGEFDAFLVE